MKLANGALPAGSPGAGEIAMIYEKPFSLPICCNIYIPIGEQMAKFPVPCCCMLPKIETKTPDGRFLGYSEYECDINMFVPKWKVHDPQGNVQYLVRSNTCCGGCCVELKCGGPGAKAVYTPFYIRDPQSLEPLPSNLGEPAQIRKVWSGFKKECCTDADNFHVIFPAGVSEEVKANLLGACINVDFSYYETQDQ